jgi:hypothetical protein
VHEIREKLGSNITEEIYNNLLKDFDVNNDGEVRLSDSDLEGGVQGHDEGPRQEDQEVIVQLIISWRVISVIIGHGMGIIGRGCRSLEQLPEVGVLQGGLRGNAGVGVVSEHALR